VRYPESSHSFMTREQGALAGSRRSWYVCPGGQAMVTQMELTAATEGIGELLSGDPNG
jgi:hypothetical protein